MSDQDATSYTCVIAGGKLMIDQIDLSTDEAYARVNKLSRMGREAYLLSPAPRENRFVEGNFAVVCIFGNAACVYATGLPEEEALKLASRTVKEHGSLHSKPKLKAAFSGDCEKNAIVRQWPIPWFVTGSQIVRAAYVYDMVAERERLYSMT